MFCNFNPVCNLFPVNCLPLCSGANISYVSYGNKYETLIDCVGVPLEVHVLLPSVTLSMLIVLMFPDKNLFMHSFSLNMLCCKTNVTMMSMIVRLNVSIGQK